MPEVDTGKRESPALVLECVPLVIARVLRSDMFGQIYFDPRESKIIKDLCTLLSHDTILYIASIQSDVGLFSRPLVYVKPSSAPQPHDPMTFFFPVA